MKSHKKGYTLAELLIVVAIIAVLVAISIPLFTTQLEKSRESTDLANVRSAYGEVLAAALVSDHDRYPAVSPSIREPIYRGNDVYAITIAPLSQKEDDWQGISGELFIGSVTSEDPAHWHGVPSAGGSCRIEFADEEVQIYWSGEGSSSDTVPGPEIPGDTLPETEGGTGNATPEAPSGNDPSSGPVLNPIRYPGQLQGDETFDFITGGVYEIDGKTKIYIEGNTTANQYYSPVTNNGQAFVEITSESKVVSAADWNNNVMVRNGDFFRDSDGTYYVRRYDSGQTNWNMPLVDTTCWLKVAAN